MPARPLVVIIGGGFGGLAAARALRRAPVRITLLDRQNHHLFQPLLYQVATAALSPGDIASPIRWILRKQQNVRVLLAAARAVDTTRRVVVLDEGEIQYDFLILATGVTNAYFGHDRWAAIAPGLKTLDDALTIRRSVLLAFEQAERTADPDTRRRLLTFVVIGGGPTGVELAGALAEIARHTLARDFRSIDPASARIVIVEAGPAILGTFPAVLQRAARRALARLGVEVGTGTPVTNLGDGFVELADGTRLAAGTVLWAAGVAASPIGATLGAPTDRAGRVIVERDLSIPGHPAVFVVGDLALFHQDGRWLPGIAPVAVQQAAHAARNIVRAIRSQPAQEFRYRHRGSLATIGRAAAVADFGWLRLSGWVAWITWLFVHILQLIGFRNRLVVMTQWAWSYLTHQRSVRLITGVADGGPSRGGAS